MKIASFRIQLALALGLPMFPACKSPPPETPQTPPTGDGSATTTTPTTPALTTPTTADGTNVTGKNVVIGAVTYGTCTVNQVNEWVCGLTDPYYADVAKAKAPKPHDVCGVNPIPLVQFDDYNFIDSGEWGNHEAELASFEFDPARTKDYRYRGTVRPNDVWCCYQRCATLPVATTARTSVPQGMFEHEMCVPPPDGGVSVPAKQKECPLAMELSYANFGDNRDYVDKNAPFTRMNESAKCCYSVASRRKCDESMYQDEQGNCRHPERGRPLREEQTVVLAPTQSREGWRDNTIDVFDDLDPATRAYATAAWKREAAAEHASIAAFARLSMDLMIFGAPASLIDEAHVAARDEIRHATLAYGLASTLGGTPVGPGRFAMSTAARTVTLRGLVSECFFDGCVNESIAAMSAAEAATLASHAPMQDTLDAIAVDEGRHATLAFKILAWALREGGSDIRDQLIADLGVIRAELDAPAPVPCADPDGFDPRLGVLSMAATASLRRRVLADVIVPCTEALLAQV